MVEVINLLFVLPVSFHLNILKTERILQFWNKKFVIPAREVNIFVNQPKLNTHGTKTFEINFACRRDSQILISETLELLYTRAEESSSYTEGDG